MTQLLPCRDRTMYPTCPTYPDSTILARQRGTYVPHFFVVRERSGHVGYMGYVVRGGWA